MSARRAALVITALVLAGCTTSTDARTYPLPTAHVDSGIGTICESVLVTSLILHGQVSNGSVRTWVSEGSDEVSVDWPGSFVARFTPNLVVLDGAGTVRAQEGDNIAAAPTVGDFWHGLEVCIGGGDGILIIDRGWLPASPST